jgi:hypothetical protein
MQCVVQYVMYSALQSQECGVYCVDDNALTIRDLPYYDTLPCCEERRYEICMYRRITCFIHSMDYPMVDESGGMDTLV